MNNSLRGSALEYGKAFSIGAFQVASILFFCLLFVLVQIVLPIVLTWGPPYLMFFGGLYKVPLIPLAAVSCLSIYVGDRKFLSEDGRSHWYSNPLEAIHIYVLLYSLCLITYGFGVVLRNAVDFFHG